MTIEGSNCNLKIRIRKNAKISLAEYIEELMSPAVEIRNLTVKAGKSTLIKDFSVSIPAGCVVGLLGPSGAGKTTLIKSMVGRKKVRKGSVKIFDLSADEKESQKSIGYMPQTTSLYTDLTAKENLLYFSAIKGAAPSEADIVLKEVSMEGHADKQVSVLSGGQKSRVSLAVALLGNPRLLVLDEPTVGVDPLLRLELWRRFKEMAQQGKSIIVTSHVMDEAEHCDYLMLIRDGKLLAFDKPKSLEAHTHTRTIEQTFLKLETKQ